MDIETLRAKVNTSRLLTPAERGYWLKNLPKMSQEQLQKLTHILAEAEFMSWNDRMTQYISLQNNIPQPA